MSLRIFDSHMHIGFWGPQQIHGRTIEPFRGREMDTPDKVIAHLDKCGIERAVVVPVYTPDKQSAYRTNTLALEAAKKALGRIVPGLWVDPSPGERSRLNETLQLAQKYGVYVLKTASQTWDADYSPDPATWDNAFRESIDMILDYARSTGSVIQLHTGSGKSHVRLVEKLIRYAGKEVRFHLVHMGGNVDAHFYLIPRLFEWREEGLNIVCDISWSGGFALRWLLDLASQNPLLSSCIMFASDEPWAMFQAELVKVLDAAEGKPDLLEAVLWTNASRIYSRR